MQERSLKSMKWLFVLVLVLTLPAAMSWAKSKTVLSPAAKAGQKVFQQNCALCHNANSTTAKVGPGMKGLFKAKELPTSHKPVTVDNVRDQIEKGNAAGKPLPMPPFASKLSKTQMNDLIEYLKTL